MDNATQEQQMVEIVATQDAGYFVSNGTSGALTGYTLRKGKEFVNCDEVLIMETDAESLEDCFYEWRECAQAGEEGYTYWTE
jgi:hypothetical protein